MPFDSFMTAALTAELSQKLVGWKVDRIVQPERDEIDLVFHTAKRSRLIINCTASTPYMALSDQIKENPPVPPMMCMLLRKHLSRAKITEISQPDFDRTIRITFDSGDEL
jgi:predicted ribosome quality control (RQC) complex YloA/Tae2 family protein